MPSQEKRQRAEEQFQIVTAKVRVSVTAKVPCTCALDRLCFRPSAISNVRYQGWSLVGQPTVCLYLLIILGMYIVDNHCVYMYMLICRVCMYTCMYILYISILCNVKMKEMRELNASLARSRRADKQSLLRKLQEKVGLTLTSTLTLTAREGG